MAPYRKLNLFVRQSRVAAHIASAENIEIEYQVRMCLEAYGVTGRPCICKSSSALELIGMRVKVDKLTWCYS